jgi:Rieske Fe-S protein
MTPSSLECRGCTLQPRRDFLIDTAILVAGALAAVGVDALRAAALPVRVGTALAVHDDEATYAIPDADGATMDKDNQVILVRYQQKGYAFSLSCPHQNTALRWHPEDNQFQCPKHHSRYRPDGVFISGRATRSMDRFAVKRSGDKIVVDLDTLYRQDKEPDAWAAAVIAL